ncbi:MAG: hypothetical protein IKR48_07375, partial [Kiritimatiellae bacterium]|nr:hypothetical protein [Kiritimatiellia bacterium]
SSLRGGRDGARPSPSVTATSGCLLLSLSASPLLSRAAPPPCEVIGKNISREVHKVREGGFELTALKTKKTMNQLREPCVR